MVASRRLQPPVARGERTPIPKSPTLIAAALALLVAVGYARIVRNGFVDFDDLVYIVDDPIVSGPFGAGTLADAFSTNGNGAYWQPVSVLSLAADHALFGASAVAYHLENVALHFGAAFLLFLLLVRTTGAFWRPAFTASLFAIHPVAVESVAWAIERRMLLATLLGLAALLAYVRWVRGRDAWAYGTSVILVALSLMAKAALVAAPALLLVLDTWPLGRKETRSRLLVEKLPFAAVCGAIAIVVLRSLKSGETPAAFPLRVANAVVLPFRHLAHLAWPTELSVYYPYPAEIPGWHVALAAAGLAAITAAVVACRRSAPHLLFGWTWFLLALLPTLGFRQVGWWAALADRHAHLAAIGVYVAAVWTAADALRRVRSRVAVAVAGAAAAGVLVLALTGLTVRQVGFWQDTVTLFERARSVAGAPEVHIEYMLGKSLIGAGRFDEGEKHLLEALALAPDQFEALHALGRAYIGRFDEDATHLLTRAVRVKPRDADARAALAYALNRLRRFQEAVELYRRASPGTPEGHANLAVALASLGDFEGATRECATLPLEMRAGVERYMAALRSQRAESGGNPGR